MYTMITDTIFKFISTDFNVCYKSTIFSEEIVNIVDSLSNVFSFTCFYTRNYYFDFICLFIIKFGLFNYIYKNIIILINSLKRIQSLNERK